MKKIIILFIIFFQIFICSSQNDLKEFENLLLKDKQLSDTLETKQLKVDSLLRELLVSIENSNKNQRILDSLHKENEILHLLMRDYSSQVEKLNIQNTNLKRLERIRHLYSQNSPLALPYSYHVQGGSPNGIPLYDIDTVIINNYTPTSLLGMLPDTANYFCLFYFIHADDVLPAILTYDKTGILISQKILAKSCWQGCESDCKSIIKINLDLSIEFDYDEYLYQCDDQNFSNIPYEALGYVEYSKIANNGELIFLKKIDKSKEELSKNPIIHTIQK